MSKNETDAPPPPYMVTYAVQYPPQGGAYPPPGAYQQQGAYPPQGAYQQHGAYPPHGSYEAAPPSYSQVEHNKFVTGGPVDYHSDFEPRPSGYYGQQVVTGQPQPIHVVPVMVNPPPSYMMFAVMATLCCCWPIGIFAILKSLEVGNAIARGDRQAAVENSLRAYQLSRHAVVVGAIVTVVSLVFIIAFYAAMFSV